MLPEMTRKQLDKKLEKLRLYANIERPSNGWIRSIREALGMNRQQLADRIDVSAQNIEAIELSEINDTVMLKSLKRLAEAMDCQVVYAVIPNKPLQTMVDEQMTKKAKEIVSYVGHSMALEDQMTNNDELNEQVKQIVDDLKHKKNISIIWKD